MIDALLTDFLHIVIALDILGAIALFILGAKRRRARGDQENHPQSPPPRQRTIWKMLSPFSMPRFSRVPTRDIKRLHAVLHSFQEGLH